jgi:hypothetical protein
LREVTLALPMVPEMEINTLEHSRASDREIFVTHPGTHGRGGDPLRRRGDDRRDEQDAMKPGANR